MVAPVSPSQPKIADDLLTRLEASEKACFDIGERTSAMDIKAAREAIATLQAPTLLALEAREAGYKKRIEELEGALREIRKEVYTDGSLTKAARTADAALQPRESLK